MNLRGTSVDSVLPKKFDVDQGLEDHLNDKAVPFAEHRLREDHTMLHPPPNGMKYDQKAGEGGIIGSMPCHPYRLPVADRR